jgi:hypothetical protein
MADGKGSAMPTRDDWRRGFAEPELESEDPRPTARPATPPAGTGAFEGADERGVVTVVVDDAGTVTDVVIPATWKDELPELELGSALRTAANNAFFAWLSAGLDAVDLDQQPAAPQEEGSHSPGPASEWLVREIDDLIAQFGRDYRRYRDRLRTAAAAAATATTKGVNGRIEVTMEPGHVTEVTVDRRWIQYARYTEVRTEAVTAFHAASRQAGTGGPDTVPLPASLARMRELASDPRALSRQLGLS